MCTRTLHVSFVLCLLMFGLCNTETTMPASFVYRLLDFPGAPTTLLTAFSLEFPDDLLLSNNSISSLGATTSNSSSFCLGSICMTLSKLTESLKGYIRLECGENSSLVIDDLLLLPVYRISSDCIICNLPELHISPLNVSSNSLYAVMLAPYSLQEPNNLYNSTINLLTKSSLYLPSCRIRVDSINETLTYAHENTTVNATFSLSPVSIQPCAPGDGIAIAQQISNLVSRVLYTTSVDQLSSLVRNIADLASSSVASACRLALDYRVVTQNTTVSMDDMYICTSLPGTPEWANDPCCNTTLQFTQCCAPRAIEFVERNWNTTFLPPANVTLDIRDCPSLYSDEGAVSSNLKETVVRVIADYSLHYNRISDYEMGCLSEPLPLDAFEIMIDAFNKCLLKIYGEDRLGPPCFSDKDCYTYCDQLSLRCHVPYKNAEVPFSQCLYENLPEAVKIPFRNRLGLNASSSFETLAKTLLEKTGSEHCIGPKANDLPDNTNKTMCLKDKFCNWHRCANSVNCSDECLGSHLPDYFCGKCASDGLECQEVSEPSGCVSLTIDNDVECNDVNGTWIALQQKCFLPYETQSQCLDERLCPINATSYSGIDWNRTRCDSLCYDASLNENTCVDTNCDNDCCDPTKNCTDKNVRDCVCEIDAYCCEKWDASCTERAKMTGCVNCDCIRRRFDRSYNNGTGLCIVLTASEQRCVDPYWANATYWEGRMWQHGRFATEERCTMGMCSVDPTWSKEQCETREVCSADSCPVCAGGAHAPKYACVSNESRTKCEGKWNADLKACEYEKISNISQCSQEEICKIYKNLSFCAANRSSDPTLNFKFYSCAALSPRECGRCAAQFSTCPLNQTYFQCSLKFSPCDDKKSCESSGICNDEALHHIFGGCFFDWYPNKWGFPTCNEGLEMTDFGCLNRTLKNPNVCKSLNGVWKERALTEQECNAHGAFCRISTDVGFGVHLTVPSNINVTECDACGGELVRIAQWTPSTWTKAKMGPLDWIKRDYRNVNSWEFATNFTKVRQLFESAIAGRYSEIIFNNVLCRYGSLWQRITSVLNTCTDVHETSYSPSFNPIAYKRFYPLLYDTIQSLPFKFIPTDAVAESMRSVNVSVSVLSVYDLLQYSSKQGVRDGIVDIVKSTGFRVGHVISDLVTLNISAEQNGVFPGTLCLQQRIHASGLWQDLFTVIDIAYVERITDVPNEVAPLDGDVEVVVDKRGITWICTEVERGGMYTAVVRTWLFTGTEVYCYVSASFFLVAAFAALIRLVDVLRRGDLNRITSALCCAFIAIGCGTRAAHFLLVALHQFQLLYPEDIKVWHAFISPGLLIFAVALGAFLYSTIRSPSAAFLGYRRAGQPKFRLLPALGTAGVTIIPALAASASLAYLFIYMNNELDESWDLETRIHLITINRIAYWINALLALFFMIAIPVRFYWRNKWRKYHWITKYHIFIIVIALLHYAHLSWMIFVSTEFGISWETAIHMAVFAGEEVILALLLLWALKPLRLAELKLVFAEKDDEQVGLIEADKLGYRSGHAINDDSDGYISFEHDEDAPLLTDDYLASSPKRLVGSPSSPPAESLLFGLSSWGCLCEHHVDAFLRLKKRQPLTQIQMQALGVRSHEHRRILEELIPARLALWNCVDVWMNAKDREDAMKKWNELIQDYYPGAPRFY